MHRRTHIYNITKTTNSYMFRECNKDIYLPIMGQEGP